MDLIQLSPWDLALAAALVLALALVSLRLQLGVERRLLVAAVRSTLQLGLIGLVLKTLFGLDHPLLVAALALVMLFAAGYEVMARQERRFTGIWGLGVGTLSMFVSSFGVALLALLVIVQPNPWYTPQYVIPLLGMLLGNTMTGIAVSLEHLTQTTWRERRPERVAPSRPGTSKASRMARLVIS